MATNNHTKRFYTEVWKDIWISVDEARQFASEFQCTFSDYDYIAKGLKEIDPKTIK